MNDKAQSKLPVNRRKPVGRSISASEVDKLVRSAEGRQKAGGASPVSDQAGGTEPKADPKKRRGRPPNRNRT